MWDNNSGYRSDLDHEAVLLAVMCHEDDVAVGGPDEAGQLQVVLGAWRRRLDRRNLVGLDAAELRGRVQHPDAAEQTGVHLRRGENGNMNRIFTKWKKQIFNMFKAGMIFFFHDNLIRRF